MDLSLRTHVPTTPLVQIGNTSQQLLVPVNQPALNGSLAGECKRKASTTEMIWCISEMVRKLKMRPEVQSSNLTHVYIM